jgi:WhiB family redox-sensing transcriptional regulator
VKLITAASELVGTAQGARIPIAGGLSESIRGDMDHGDTSGYELIGGSGMSGEAGREPPVRDPADGAPTPADDPSIATGGAGTSDEGVREVEDATEDTTDDADGDVVEVVPAVSGDLGTTSGSLVQFDLLGSFAAADDDEEPDWQERALCAQTDPEAFFPEKGGSTREAKRICSGCDVRAECLDYALAHDERFGIWGGLSERERRRLRRAV